ncbi:Transposon Ty3-G Gag-Pol polyprotein [Gossypium australe]|uniref:Transposon Ty3-G Gag-Pol polyprotein n=1 Tax=Gossypium australe TaxID=47621 RepID=A0A5B6VAU8_9ROSI|nr:Transposon Ty3-G Gag-Pol polyprotein [Gossypium australe]
MVCEFSDVFSKELLGLPPDREVEFAIEVFPSATPVSIAPYRTTLTEFNKIKIQLQDVLDSVFISPSISSWGAPILFVEKKDGSLWLWHVILAEGICVDSKKIEAIFQWKAPKNVLKIRSFLVLTNYYRRMVRKANVVDDALSRKAAIVLEIVEYVAKYLTCQWVKVEHQVPTGLLQPISIPEWVCERVMIEFVICLPISPNKRNVIWEIADRSFLSSKDKLVTFEVSRSLHS